MTHETNDASDGAVFDDVLFDVRGRAGFVTLNRPKALNALNHAMVRAIITQLDAWDDDPSVAHVVIEAAGDRAFCAGGDIRVIYEQGRGHGAPGNPAQLEFFADEYRLNARLKHYPKPTVALIDGIVMGGGVGLSVHGTHRVGGARTTFAMPEVGIGFFPDVGATYVLPRMPRQTGIYCALTGGRLKQADALWAGILTHAVPSERFAAIALALEQATDIVAVLDGFHEQPPADAKAEPLADLAPDIERIFSGPDVAAILAGLDAESGAHAEWAARTAAAIRRQSPTSVCVVFAQMRRGAKLDFDDAMRLEFRIVSHILKGHDFYEGVRAVIIDKDGAPQWRPARLEDVAAVDVETHFVRPQDGDLVLTA
ncbi:enoyl-CoA hydratase/isomerase family protein [Breoghania sp. L-A4]|uniref:enoyl-CoA hydratase/isomerase family protein n=1 Tax=Breoghania sp. L-A4 TaxID=2304600 RepID=UPI000E35BE63|nr:enoyl-CoA hydratase/isomerase family protein [Breoghania sp. L-A4]AXS40257.1 enoyl-CoA hydratase/isomerase family protein [Breoghania sp. L-A4]